MKKDLIPVHFDMETCDPDDAVTLLWLLGCSQTFDLKGVTICPGDSNQVGLVEYILHLFGKTQEVPIGAFKYRDNGEKNCVSGWHYKLFPALQPSTTQPPEGWRVLEHVLQTEPKTTLITGGPLSNIAALLSNNPTIQIETMAIQGGFAGSGVVPEELQLAKFKGMNACVTTNFNANINATTAVLTSGRIQRRVCVGKNICHGVCYTEQLEKKFETLGHTNLAAYLLSEGLSKYRQASYLGGHPKGKALHDLVAACLAVDTSFCDFREVEITYRKEAHGWGSQLKDGTKTWIAISCSKEKFDAIVCDHLCADHTSIQAIEKTLAQKRKQYKNQNFEVFPIAHLQTANVNPHPMDGVTVTTTTTETEMNPETTSSVYSLEQLTVQHEKHYGNILLNNVHPNTPPDKLLQIAKDKYNQLEDKPGGRGVVVSVDLPDSIKKLMNQFPYLRLNPDQGTLELKGWIGDNGEFNMRQNRIPDASTSIQGVTFLPVDKNGCTVLVREGTRFGGKLKLVSGGVDRNEDLIEACLREMREEVGVDRNEDLIEACLREMREEVGVFIAREHVDKHGLRLLGGYQRSKARPGGMADCHFILGMAVNRSFSSNELRTDGVETTDALLMKLEDVLGGNGKDMVNGVQSAVKCWLDGPAKKVQYNPGAHACTFV